MPALPAAPALLVVPCFNEAARWQGDYWREMLRQVNAHFLFVDDGSTDQTCFLLQAFVQEHIETASFLGLSKNSGKAEAIRRGWLHALACNDPNQVPSVIGFLDADGAFGTEDVKHALALLEDELTVNDVDACWSARVALAGRDIRRNMKRHYLGRLVATYLSIGEVQIPYDTQSGFKLFYVTPQLVETLSTPFRTRWLFEVEMLSRFAQIAHRPMRIWEMPLALWVDVAGSKITLRESRRIAGELLRLKAIQRAARRHRTKLDDHDL